MPRPQVLRCLWDCGGKELDSERLRKDMGMKCDSTTDVVSYFGFWEREGNLDVPLVMV